MGIREMEARAREDLQGKRNSGPQGWPAWRLPVWLRVLVVVAAGAGIVVSAQWTVEAYRETVVYRQAADCPAGTGSCIGREETRVMDKAEFGGCSGSGSNRSCTTKYKLRINGVRGTEWLEVGSGVYDAAVRGSRAGLRTWHGAVVSITVRGHTQTFPPPSEDSMWMRTAAVWLLLGLALWAGLSGLLDALVQACSLGWVFLTVPLVLLVDNALFGAGVGKWLVAVALALGFIGGTVGAHRQELRKKRRRQTA
ncbi:hypothetical protein ACFY1L_38980 [Streptomyces sp. NPDC001663]|uniref:hypothetical protein n=1 Tax=Streptomyces sp. NPDC001663 TaxID=3364597 RepID=UPI00367E3511